MINNKQNSIQLIESKMTYFIKFHLKTEYQGNSIPVIYGSIPELGGGNPAKGMPLKPDSSIYNYFCELRVKKPKNSEETHWYSYCYRPAFGATIFETVPKRNFPQLSNLSGSNIELFDSSKSVASISNLVIRFRVKLQAEFGTELFLIGDCKELGNWQTKGSQQLFFDKQTNSWFGDVCFPLTSTSRTIQYKYFFTNQKDEIQWEPGDNHLIHLDSVISPAFIEISDTYRWPDPVMNSLTRSAFTSVLTKRTSPTASPRISPNSVQPNEVSLIFTAVCPWVKKNQTLAIVGSCPQLGLWTPDRSITLTDAEFPFWTASITVSRDCFPFQYKYVICDNEIVEETEEPLYIWEEGENHECLGITSNLVDLTFPSTVIITDWYVNPNKELFRGMGIHLPLFSLRTSENCGIGEYSDIRHLVDLCKSIGSSMIQLLPLNDTSSSCNADDPDDKNPYHSISCFALHPIYINLLEILPNLPSDIFNEIQSKRYEYSQNDAVNYQQVYRFKLSILNRIFIRIKDEVVNDKEFIDFCDDNEDWLTPYSIFCLLRDENHSSEFWSWKDNSFVTPDTLQRLHKQRENETTFLKWIQFIADQQLRASKEYATSQRVILKTEIPFGIQRNSVDCWSNPRLFDINMYEVNYGYAAYNWRAMKSTNFSWWKKRLARISAFYHSAQLNHIYGFFRSQLCHVDGVVSQYQPSTGISRQELESRGLWDIDRYTKPYIRFHHLREKFNEDASTISKEFFVARNIDHNDDYYDFKESFITIKTINQHLETLIPEKEKRSSYSQHLLELLNNVILIQGLNNDSFHFRADLASDQPISSLKELDNNQRQVILDLSNEYKHKSFWINEAIPRLQILANSNNLLLFSEETEQDLQDFDHEIEAQSIIPLKVPRYSKELSTSFSYFSQCEPALPNTSTIRGWYEENKTITRSFCKDELGQNDNEIVEYCYTDTLVKIIDRYMKSPSMWCVFMLQDIVNTFDRLRREYPNEERIFISKQSGLSNADNNLYKFPWKLEDLNNDAEWTNYICSLVKDSQRY